MKRDVPLKGWEKAGERQATASKAPRPDPEMAESARQARIDAAMESTQRDAEMLAEHMKKLNR